jgi:type I restriction-modification system DNA methylase subunit
MNAKIELAENIRQILARSTITETSVTLPEALDRDTYLEVDKVLKAAGGKWSRKDKAHVFKTDPRAALGLAIEQGTITNIKKQNQAFYTPEKLAYALVASAVPMTSKPLKDCLVLEPSAGQGALLQVMNDIYISAQHTIACEIDPANKEDLAVHANTVIIGDFLTSDVGNQFDLVLMNPPFAGNTYADHVARAYSLLAPQGVLAAIVPAGFTTSTVARVKELRDTLLKNKTCIVRPNPEGSFSESGTEVQTLTILVKKS